MMQIVRAAICMLLLLVAGTAEAKPRAKRHAGHRAAPANVRAKHPHHAAPAVAVDEPVRGQSIGVPWSGRLVDAARLSDGDGYVIRRPWRAFGTRSTVELIERVVERWRYKFPEAHVLAIGDISAEHGGAITEHHSHQSGRDVDVGLVYHEQPAEYPSSFVTATAKNLDCAATLALITGFASTAHDDGGAEMIFLDYDVQGMLVRWAEAHGLGDDTLALFQYPHRGGAGLVRHVPNHANHMHVRFRCPRGDSACR